ncbi:MAG: hypothetical protein ACR2FH_07300 [Caulobacteraceae bacterium]
MRRLIVRTTLACLIAMSSASAGACATVAPAPVMDPSRERALKEPIDLLARESMKQIASEFVEVERPTFRGMIPPGVPLWSLRFATQATSAGDPGLCVATVADVFFQTGKGDDTPPLSTTTVYKVVAPLKPLPDMWNNKYGAELAAKCEHAGRVIPTQSANFGQEIFFEAKMDGGLRVWFAVRALEVGLEKVRLSPRSARCEDQRHGNGAGCKLELSSQVTLRLPRLLSVTMTDCNNGDKDCYQVTGEFLRSSVANSRTTWIMHLQATAPDTTASGDIRAVNDIEVSESGSIFD